MDASLKIFSGMDPPHHDSYLEVENSGKFLDSPIKIFKTDPLPLKNTFPCHDAE